MIGSIDNDNRFALDTMAASHAFKFESMDANGNGVLSPDEIDALVERMEEEKGIKLDLESFAAALDKDGNGGIDLAEFGDIRPMTAPRFPLKNPWGPMVAPPKFGERVFNRLDSDESGDLSKDEVNELLTRLSEQTGAEVELEAVMTKLDEDGDGLLNIEEAEGLKEEMGPPPGIARKTRYGEVHQTRAMDHMEYTEDLPVAPGESDAIMPSTVEILA